MTYLRKLIIDIRLSAYQERGEDVNVQIGMNKENNKANHFNQLGRKMENT